MSLTKVSYSMIDGTPINIKDFGAIGDGVANDTSAIQSVLDYTLTQTQIGKNVAIYIPKGVYRCSQLNFDPSAPKGSGRIKMYGEYGASVLLSTINDNATPFFNVGKYGGYGSGNDWFIDGIFFKSENAKKGIGLNFEALSWSAKVSNCIFEAFNTNIQLFSPINFELQNSRVISADVGFYQDIATTGIPDLDQIPANTRVSHCYFGGRGDGSFPNRIGIFGSNGAGGGMGFNCIIDACVFEGNTEAAIANLAPTSVVSSSWFETVTDVINGELFNVCVMNNFTAYPLFANFFNTLLPSNRNILLNNGVDLVNPPYGNIYQNILNRIQTDYIRATTNIFCGVDTTGVTTPVLGQGHFQSVNPQIYVRNSSATAGKYWQIGPDNSGNSFTVFNQNSAGVFLADGATAWAANSDERTKDIIEPITDAVSKIMSLRAVIGKYKTDQEGVRRSFLIAQDVQAVFPEAIVQKDDSEEKYLGVAYTDLIPLLVSAVTELAKEVKKLS